MVSTVSPPNPTIDNSINASSPGTEPEVGSVGFEAHLTSSSDGDDTPSDGAGDATGNGAASSSGWDGTQEVVADFVEGALVGGPLGEWVTAPVINAGGDAIGMETDVTAEHESAAEVAGHVARDTLLSLTPVGWVLDAADVIYGGVQIADGLIHGDGDTVREGGINVLAGAIGFIPLVGDAAKISIKGGAEGADATLRATRDRVARTLNDRDRQFVEHYEAHNLRASPDLAVHDSLHIDLRLPPTVPGEELLVLVQKGVESYARGGRDELARRGFGTIEAGTAEGTYQLRYANGQTGRSFSGTLLDDALSDSYRTLNPDGFPDGLTLEQKFDLYRREAQDFIENYTLGAYYHWGRVPGLNQNLPEDGALRYFDPHKALSERERAVAIERLQRAHRWDPVQEDY